MTFGENNHGVGKSYHVALSLGLGFFVCWTRPRGKKLVFLSGKLSRDLASQTRLSEVAANVRGAAVKALAWRRVGNERTLP